MHNDLFEIGTVLFTISMSDFGIGIRTNPLHNDLFEIGTVLFTISMDLNGIFIVTFGIIDAMQTKRGAIEMNKAMFYAKNE